MENKVIFCFILLDEAKHNQCFNTVTGDFSKGKKEKKPKRKQNPKPRPHTHGDASNHQSSVK